MLLYVFEILWVLYKFYSCVSIIITFLFSFLLLPQLFPTSTFKIVPSEVLQANKLANQASWTCLQVLRCLRNDFLIMLPVGACCRRQDVRRNTVNSLLTDETFQKPSSLFTAEFLLWTRAQLDLSPCWPLSLGIPS